MAKKSKIATKLTACVLSAVMLLSPLGASAQGATVPNDLSATYENFQAPPISAKTRPLWFWNEDIANMSKEKIREIMVESVNQSGYGGFGILPFQNRADFMSEEYLELYRYALQTAEELGLHMCLYDEFGFPSGSAGGQVQEKYPEHLAKRLDKFEKKVIGPGRVEMPIGEGDLMGAVIMNNETKEIIDISDHSTLVEGAHIGKVTASSTFAAPGYEADKACDCDLSTRWNSAPGQPTGEEIEEWVELDYLEEITFDRVNIVESAEPILQRVGDYAIQYWNGNDWVTLAEGNQIGTGKSHSFEPVTAQKLRLLIKSLWQPDSATISEIEVFNGNEQQVLTVNEEQSARMAWEIPEGDWTFMAFNCVLAGSEIVDYLDANSVDKFIELTYDTYYAAFPEYFGNVIDRAFFDEPSLVAVEGGKMWTPRFNEMFEEEYGYNPITLYPALWYDIGENTASAKATLHSFRSDLFSENYVGHVREWCKAHGIQLQGHMVCEEATDPVLYEGDLMKAMKNQDIPGVDMISLYRNAEEAYKIVSSIAYNWDKELVMSESYGAFGAITKEELYKTAMDQYAKGINDLIPHAIWYNDDPATIAFPPELSYRGSFSEELPVYNNYIGRLNTLLQGGRHTADIGVLYPIESLQVNHSFTSGAGIDGLDYMRTGELLIKELQRDYTWIHPEVLSDRISVEGDTLKLNNEKNFEEYKVFVLPSSNTISYANLLKLKEFYDNGGKVIAASQLPYQSVEPGHNADVIAIIKEMFGVDPTPGDHPGTLPGITITGSSSFGGTYSELSACDGNLGTRWNSGAGGGNGQWVEVDFGKEVSFNKTITYEAFDRTFEYHVQYWDKETESWVNCVGGDAIGSKKVDTFETVTSQKVRLYIDKIVSDSVSIYEFEVYLDDGPNLITGKKADASYTFTENDNGGKAYLLSSLNEDALRAATDDALAVYDVEFEDQFDTADGNFAYIHKVKDGRDIYFIANSNSYEVDSYARIRGEITPVIWDPMTGERSFPEYSYVEEDGQTVTRVKLNMTGVQSLFIVDESVELPDTVVTAPSEAIVNEQFEVSVTAPADAEHVYLFNESGWKMVLSDLAVSDNQDGSKTFTFKTSVGTVGQGRTFTVALSGADGVVNPIETPLVIDILAPTPAVLGASVDETAVVNQPFALNVTTDKTVTKLDVYNEFGLKMVVKDASYEDTDEGRVWTATLSAGTKGTRTFNVIGKNKFGNQSAPVTTNPVTINPFA